VRFLSPSERALTQAISNLAYCNPFLPERIRLEKEILGDDFVEVDTVWSKRPDQIPTEEPNVDRIIPRVETLAESLLERLAAGASPAPEALQLYEDLVLFLLFHRYHTRFRDLLAGAARGKPSCVRAPFYRDFVGDMERFLYDGLRGASWRGAADGVRESGPTPRASAEEARAVEGGGTEGPERLAKSDVRDRRFGPPHVFACFFQIRRAFYHIFENIIGGSMPMAQLRAAVWQSIFSHDLRRYRRALYDRMADITCLVTGESGTGKELVARAIGLARYVPFDPQTESFTDELDGSFYPLNLSALSPTLIESELFGHRRGAFTGALQDRAGWFEVCPPLGTVFLDEIGEIEAAIQVKLLRVIETRIFQRIGDTRERRFPGKIISATNRDLAGDIRAGRFREDLYYRLCSDRIVTPTLRRRLSDSPDALPNLVLYIAQRVTNEEEAGPLAQEVVEWIDKNLGLAYPWPGNFRELEQCVRNVMIRKDYRPLSRAARDPAEEIIDLVRNGSLTAEDLLRRYCTLVYASAGGNCQEAARRLGLDHRTVKSKIDPDLLAAYRGEAQETSTGSSGHS